MIINDLFNNKKTAVAEGSLEEVDRRGFLKGMGAAAVAGAAGGANADWERQQDFVDNLSGDKEIRFVNISPDSNYFLRFVSTGQGPVFYIGGLNFHLTKSGKGRIKIDNGKVHTISFVPTDDKTSLHTSKIQPLDVSITDLSKEIFSAKQKILIDVTEVTPGAPEERQRVATFIPKFSYKKESVEQGVAEDMSDDMAAMAKKKFPNAYISKNGQEVQKPENWGKRYTPPPAAPADLEKQQRDLTAKYPNIDELVRKAELNRDPDYEMADGEAYYAARDAEQNYQKLRQIQRVIQGLNESLQRTQP